MTCAALTPDSPLVRGLLDTVDCNVETLVAGAYAGLFQPAGAFSGLLTQLMIIFVALIGYRLILGLGALRVGDLVLTAAKLGLVLALCTQWSLYQTLAFRFLFDGPEALASAVLSVRGNERAIFSGDVFDGLQATLDYLNSSADRFAARAPGQISPLLGGAGFGAFALTTAASILLIATLGVLLAAKIVLGLLLAIGPVFIALALFAVTRGFFEGWLRAAVASAFAPLAGTVLLGFALKLLEPWLVQLAAQQAAGTFALGPVNAILTLVLVFATVSAGLIGAGIVIAVAFRLPAPAQATVRDGAATPGASVMSIEYRTRAAQTVEAVRRLEQRGASAPMNAADVAGRRIVIDRAAGASAVQAAPASPTVATDSSRRTALPKPRRSAPST